ncbi:hypothetical protein BZB76_0109 [Actinomadura pelletieri DSM 43383]|uniref:Uncharacterized protein n=1 Tax=Actinomadura pelletieri DSM 43383 TaxID=1120940 RepID=A0A495QWX2_9ACTN|nr:hypothetical protein [Actinomadura pelletieri]RKS78685.1 hypothetical protein BZB76_0109 [Actinomadura pelletieri DSM 43383]
MLSGQSNVFHQELTLVPTDTVNPLTGHIRFDADACCVDGPCAGNTTWDGALVWGRDDKHVAVGNTTHTWTGGNQAGAKNVLHLSPKITAYATLPPLVNEQMPSRGWTALDAEIRYDGIVGAQPGCVFTKYRPTWTFNSKKVSAAAAHAWLIRSTLPNHPGSKQHNAPMYYLAPRDRADNPGRTPDDNRDVICLSGWAKKNAHPETASLPEINSKDVPSCDEFAFAASYNSSGMPAAYGGLNSVSSGDQCLKTYATRKVRGEWHLYNDERKQAPTFRELCGRSAMSNWIKGTSMGGAFSSGFSGKYRLLNRDPYWVSTPGFEHCNASTRPVRCTMSMSS